MTLQEGMGLVCSISMPGWSRVTGQSDHYYPFLRPFYTHIACYDCKNVSVTVCYRKLLYLLVRFWRNNGPIITYNNRPIITVIMDPWLPIARPIMSTNGPITDGNWPTQLGDTSTNTGCSRVGGLSHWPGSRCWPQYAWLRTNFCHFCYTDSVRVFESQKCFDAL